MKDERGERKDERGEMKDERGERKEERGERKEEREKNNGRVQRAQPSSNQKTIFYKKSIFIKCRATLAKEPDKSQSLHKRLCSTQLIPRVLGIGSFSIRLWGVNPNCRVIRIIAFGHPLGPIRHPSLGSDLRVSDLAP